MSKASSRWASLLLMAGLLVSFMPLGVSQQIAGSLTGTVLDNSQAVIPNANITLKNESSGDTRRTVSNADGYFTLSAIPSGVYTISIEVSGFQKWERTGLAITGAERRNLNDIVLNVGSTGEQVTILAASEIITPDSGEKASTITTKELQNIAVVGRSAAEFIKILPGMAQSGSGVENRPGYTGEVMGINGNSEGGH